MPKKPWTKMLILTIITCTARKVTLSGRTKAIKKVIKEKRKEERRETKRDRDRERQKHSFPYQIALT